LQFSINKSNKKAWVIRHKIRTNKAKMFNNSRLYALFICCDACPPPEAVDNPINLRSINPSCQQAGRQSGDR